LVSDLSLSLSQPTSLSLYFLSPVLLRGAVTEQLWWAPGVQPGSAHHNHHKGKGKKTAVQQSSECIGRLG